MQTEIDKLWETIEELRAEIVSNRIKISNLENGNYGTTSNTL